MFCRLPAVLSASQTTMDHAITSVDDKSTIKPSSKPQPRRRREVVYQVQAGTNAEHRKDVVSADDKESRAQNQDDPFVRFRQRRQQNAEGEPGVKQDRPGPTARDMERPRTR